MRFATLTIGSETCAARLEGDQFVLLDSPDVGALLSMLGRAHEKGAISANQARFAPLVIRPHHIFCVGLNYRDHIAEMGREIPEYPTLFAKFPSALAGANDDLAFPTDTVQMDWEAELAVVVGSDLRRVDPPTAAAGIAGFTVANDVSMRDWQRRTTQWLQGKTFERSTPVGPVLVTTDELGDGRGLDVVCAVDGRATQRSNTDQLLFTPAEVLSYLSAITTLRPGDLVLTGTPGGVGAAEGGTLGLRPGQVMTTSVSGIGECRNRIIVR